MNSDATTIQFSDSQHLVADVVLQDLSIRINQAPLTDKLSHTFIKGQWTCILGPSGVGKTMMLQAILGLLTAPHNTGVTWEGAVQSTHGHQISGHVSYMAQQDLLFPWLSVKQNVDLGGRLRGSCDEVADVDTDALLDAVGLSEFAQVLPNALSGGMRQRVALARTLKENRQIIVMDEPFSALDAITRLRLQDLAATFLTGRTVIMVTHDPLEALRLADEILVLTGRPATFGDPIRPSGETPRDVENPQILSMQGQLLSELMAGLP